MNDKLKIAMLGHKRIPSREGGNASKYIEFEEVFYLQKIAYIRSMSLGKRFQSKI